MVHKTKILVLRGGESGGYEDSLKNGLVVLKNLSRDKYIAYDAIISPSGHWFFEGRNIVPEKILKRIDLVFSVVGDSGKTKRFLDCFGIPYVGSDSLGSAISDNKYLIKKICHLHSIKTPYYKIIRKDSYHPDVIFKVFKEVPMPCVIKPLSKNQIIFSKKVYSLSEINEAIEQIFSSFDALIIEEFIRGKEIFCGVIENFRNQNFYSSLPMDAFNFKMAGVMGENEKQKIQELSVTMHNTLGLKDYSHSHFIYSPKRGIFLLKTSPDPDFSENSLLRKMLEGVGAKHPDLIEHLIALKI